MMYLFAKAALSGVIIAAVSEIARRSPALGALVASLPLVSLLAVIWLWRDTADVERIAAHLQATFWLVIPSLPMFLAVPAMLRAGMTFWPSLGAGVALTVALYLAAIALLPRIGIGF
ncbi:MAG: DUF3147 family protein [Alphaproteobacteria bacterium]|nr:DUF3147 family protein [Alphaproteobacteria bacterium]